MAIALSGSLGIGGPGTRECPCEPNHSSVHIHCSCPASLLQTLHPHADDRRTNIHETTTCQEDFSPTTTAVAIAYRLARLFAAHIHKKQKQCQIWFRTFSDRRDVFFASIWLQKRVLDRSTLASYVGEYPCTLPARSCLSLVTMVKHIWHI